MTDNELIRKTCPWIDEIGIIRTKLIRAEQNEFCG